MASYKLTYFNLRGRGELSRLLFAKAGVEFEDERIQQEQWSEKKSGTPWGSLPILKVGDFELGQSLAIARYLATKFDLEGKSATDKAKADMIVSASADVLMKYTNLHFMEDEEAKAEAKKKLDESDGTHFMVKIAEYLESNSSGYLVGDCMTWADLAVFNNLYQARDEAKMQETYPKTLDYINRIAEDPNIKQYIAARPETAC